MIEALLPQVVASAWTHEAPTPDGELFAAERELVARAVDKRRREFAAVRGCARAALGQIGQQPVPVLKGPRGEPLWPAGVVGSMTHCTGYYAAAVARAGQVRALGIDAEPANPLPEGVLSTIALPTEQELIRWAASEICWDRLLFSAKESVFKTWYPLTRVDLAFDDAEITFSGGVSGGPPMNAGPGAGSGTFAVRLLRPLGSVPTEFTGRWLVRDGIAMTAVVIPA